MNYSECTLFDSLGLSTIRVLAREDLVLGLKPTKACSFVTSLFFRCTAIDAMSLPPRRSELVPFPSSNGNVTDVDQRCLPLYVNDAPFFDMRGETYAFASLEVLTCTSRCG